MTYLRIALGTFKVFAQNKLRTFLSALGIIIGIGAVSGLMSVGEAAQGAIESQIQSLGSNIITVIPGLISFGPQNKSLLGNSSTLTNKDADAIAKIKADGKNLIVSPESTQSGYISYKETSVVSSIYGAEPVYQTVHETDLSDGRFINKTDIEKKKYVAILGAAVAKELFPENKALDKKIKIRDKDFTVIGVAAGHGSLGAVALDNTVLIPLQVSQDVFKQTNLNMIYISAPSRESVDGAVKQIDKLLLKRHEIKDKKEADFTVMTQEDILSMVDIVTGILSGLLAAVASISLVVGGVGILNTMLFAVVQRTREIGLRKALGATKGQILWQFLVESILLTLIGGVIGVGLALAVTSIAGYYLDFEVPLGITSIAIAAGVSIGIGLIFGLAPAQRAARLNPIEALRHE